MIGARSVRGVSLPARSSQRGCRRCAAVAAKALPGGGGGGGGGSGFGGFGGSGGSGGSGDGEHKKKLLSISALALSLLPAAEAHAAAKKQEKVAAVPEFDGTAFLTHFGSAFGLSGVIGYASARLGELPRAIARKSTPAVRQCLGPGK